MQSIDEIMIDTLSPHKLLEHCKEHKIDFNKPINIIRWGESYKEISILIPFILLSDSYDYIKVFIEAGANANVVSEDKSESFFRNLIRPDNIQELKLCLPYFNLTKNREIMYQVHYYLKGEDTLDKEFKDVLYELISKFNQKEWKKNLKRFTTDKYYTAKTASEFFDSYPFLY